MICLTRCAWRLAPDAARQSDGPSPLMRLATDVPVHDHRTVNGQVGQTRRKIPLCLRRPADSACADHQNRKLPSLRRGLRNALKGDTGPTTVHAASVAAYHPQPFDSRKDHGRARFHPSGQPTQPGTIRRRPFALGVFSLARDERSRSCSWSTVTGRGVRRPTATEE